MAGLAGARSVRRSVWLLSGASGQFWPVWVLVIVVLSLARNLSSDARVPRGTGGVEGDSSLIAANCREPLAEADGNVCSVL
jgi:hypothetical protein